MNRYRLIEVTRIDTATTLENLEFDGWKVVSICNALNANCLTVICRRKRILEEA